MQTLHEIQENFTGTHDSVVLPPTLTMEAEINAEHQLARESASSAVQHAIRCGQLLVEQKSRLEHGEFGEWIAEHCDFEQSTATRYMKAARQIATGVAISNLSGLFPSGRQPCQKRTDAPLVDHVVDDDHEETSEPPAIAPEQAIEILESIPSQRQIVSRFRGWRSKVGKYRSILRRAELELAEAESALIRAALKQRGLS